MKLKLIRLIFAAEYTEGQLYIDDEYFCDTIEDALRKVKIKHITCIDAGTYKVSLTYSSVFRRVLPLLHDVPKFSGIRIHRGNTAEHSSGCIIVGKKIRDGFVGNSTETEKLLLKKLEGINNIEIEII